MSGSGDDLQVMFTYYVPKLAHDGVVPLTMLPAAGQSVRVEAPVAGRRKRRDSSFDGAYPAYFILWAHGIYHGQRNSCGGIFTDLGG